MTGTSRPKSATVLSRGPENRPLNCGWCGDARADGSHEECSA